MANNVIELQSIGELLGKNFFIPSYQRGYRWTGQQVKDLLDDIEEFRHSKVHGFYCLQPLVVKKSIVNANTFRDEFNKLPKTEDILLKATELINNHTQWEVIDGQQRLTTLCILLNYLGNNNPYHVEYETRKNSAEYLKKITAEVKENADNVDNVDYYHMHLVYEEIKHWFGNKKEEIKEEFKDTILNRVKFIWYESVEKDPIEVFTRLNIGKIKLTNAELIKALLLNRANFTDDNSIVLRQQEIASRWDQIEYTLQDDAFWLFLHSEKYKPATRIDFIFDLICDNDPWNIYTIYTKKKCVNTNESEKKKRKVIGTDEYKTFRYFYEYFHRGEEQDQKDKKVPEERKNHIEILQDCWKEVVKYFQILQEWYNDPIYYHYIGYLLSLTEDHKTKIKELLKFWNNNNKESFKTTLEDKIKETITYLSLNQQYKFSSADESVDSEVSKMEKTTQKQSKKESNPDKTKCKPILLLHNIQTVINQNEGLINSSQYGLPVFYKFPFHLYKKEKWDVEHIDSNTTNKLDKLEDQKQWLRDVVNNDIAKERLTDQNLKDEISEFEKANKDEGAFNELWEKVYRSIERDTEKLDDDEKNKIWNFCLLNASTNRSYGNAIFPVKRQTIINKDQGINDDQQDDNQAGKKNVIAFVPPVTKNVFLKYYTKSNVQFRTWSKSDAKAYRDNICETLQKFGVKKDENDIK